GLRWATSQPAPDRTFTPSGQSHFNSRVKALESNLGIGCGELPVDTYWFRVTVRVPVLVFFTHFFLRRHAPIPTLALQRARLGFRDVQPTSMFRRMHNFQFLRNA